MLFWAFGCSGKGQSCDLEWQAREEGIRAIAVVWLVLSLFSPILTKSWEAEGSSLVVSLRRNFGLLLESSFASYFQRQIQLMQLPSKSTCAGQAAADHSLANRWHRAPSSPPPSHLLPVGCEHFLWARTRLHLLERPSALQLHLIAPTPLSCLKKHWGSAPAPGTLTLRLGRPWGCTVTSYQGARGRWGGRTSLLFLWIVLPLFCVQKCF